MKKHNSILSVDPNAEYIHLCDFEPINHSEDNAKAIQFYGRGDKIYMVKYVDTEVASLSSKEEFEFYKGYCSNLSMREVENMRVEFHELPAVLQRFIIKSEGIVSMIAKNCEAPGVSDKIRNQIILEAYLKGYEVTQIELDYSEPEFKVGDGKLERCMGRNFYYLSNKNHQMAIAELRYKTTREFYHNSMVVYVSDATVREKIKEIHTLSDQRVDQEMQASELRRKYSDKTKRLAKEYDFPKEVGLALGCERKKYAKLREFLDKFTTANNTNKNSLLGLLGGEKRNHKKPVNNIGERKDALYEILGSELYELLGIGNFGKRNIERISDFVYKICNGAL